MIGEVILWLEFFGTIVSQHCLNSFPALFFAAVGQQQSFGATQLHLEKGSAGLGTSLEKTRSRAQQ